MSTTYNILEKGKVLLDVEEHSCLLDISMGMFTESWFSIDDLTPQELVNVALKLIQVASYFDIEETVLGKLTTVDVIDKVHQLTSMEFTLHNYCNNLPIQLDPSPEKSEKTGEDAEDVEDVEDAQDVEDALKIPDMTYDDLLALRKYCTGSDRLGKLDELIEVKKSIIPLPDNHPVDDAPLRVVFTPDSPHDTPVDRQRIDGSEVSIEELAENARVVNKNTLDDVLKNHTSTNLDSHRVYKQKMLNVIDEMAGALHDLLTDNANPDNRLQHILGVTHDLGVLCDRYLGRWLKRCVVHNLDSHFLINVSVGSDSRVLLSMHKVG